MSDWNWKSIYVFLAKDKKVKIGVSGDVQRRLKDIEYAAGIDIIDYFSTDLCSNPYLVEKICHEVFNDCRIFGEWFSVDFQDAVNGVKAVFDNHARFEERDAKELDYLFKILHEPTDYGEVSMLCEIIMRQEMQITSLCETVESLSKSVIDISEMIKALNSRLLMPRNEDVDA